MNGETIVLRGGVFVDMNGDGLGNDGVRISNIMPDSASQADNGRLYFTALLYDAAWERVGGGFMWIPLPVRADTNCDGRIDFFDIDPFLLALFDAPGYATAYPDCWMITADINRDGLVDSFDIDPLVNCLFGGCGVQAP